LDTVFSVGLDPIGNLKVSVLDGARGVRVSSRQGTRTVGAGLQLSVDSAGNPDQLQGFDAQTQRVWAIYGPAGELDGAVPDLDLKKCTTPNTLYPRQDDARLGCAVQDATIYHASAPGLAALYEGGEV